MYDFVALKKLGRRICDSLDHRFLLPTRNPHLKIRHTDQHWEIDFKDSHYCFPEKDVKPLPLDNVTAERLAEFIWGKVAQEIYGLGDHELDTLTIGVEEAEGQVAFYACALSGE